MALTHLFREVSSQTSHDRKKKEMENEPKVNPLDVLENSDRWFLKSLPEEFKAVIVLIGKRMYDHIYPVESDYRTNKSVHNWGEYPSIHNQFWADFFSNAGVNLASR